MNRTPRRSLKVFLCHCKEDEPTVTRIYDRLMQDGIEPWFDTKNLLPGQDWRLEIERAVRASDVVLVCLSHTSVAKEGHAQNEIKQALKAADDKPEGTIYVIPLRLDDCQVPAKMSAWQWVNYFESEGYNRLRLALQARATQIGVDLREENPP